MHAQINQLVKSLLQKNSLEECSVQELQQFADRHPFFGAAQLLLTKKLKSENSDRYNAQLQKTFLFFHNPLWVENLLSDAGDAKISIPEKAPPVMAEISVAEAVPAEAEPVTLPVNESSQVSTSPEIVEHIVEETQNGADVDSAGLPGISIASIKQEFDAPVKDSGPVFEPYHTVDYFASQGIREKEDNRPEDKFGRQLKSFTAWLKTMKRLPGTESLPATEPAIEKKVDELAEYSIKDRDVITEAMAEVWIKQGNREKAIAVYRKLSLLEPAKSAYFAAKIEDLK